jgi:hypothetical protein
MAVDFWRRRRLVWIALLVMAIVGGLFWSYSNRGWTAGKIGRHIKRELPLGSTRWEVEMWLDRHEIEHDYYENSAKGNLLMDLDWKQANPESAGLNRHDLAGMVWATIQNANVGWLGDGDIDVYFFFDKSGRLVGQSIEKFIYGL